jgi:hypothetical protein
MIYDSENAIQSGHGHHNVQETHPFDATRKSISSSLRPRSPLRLFPQSRQELDDCAKYPSYPFVLLPYLTVAILCFTDLAVIFRPGLMSHPTHELSPSEHRLSQEVLEFLIAHQDWFMLDTPPPPVLPPTPSRSLTPPLSPGASVSVSDDEGPEGWRIIDRHPRIPGDPGKYGGAAGTSGTSAGAQGRAHQMPPLSPTAAGKASPRIMRSRTMPSSRNGRASTVDAGAAQRGTGPSGSTPSPAVLRKGRRSSAQPA